MNNTRNKLQSTTVYRYKPNNNKGIIVYKTGKGNKPSP